MALTALVNGSMVLTGKVCGCAAHAVKLAWDAAATDVEATAKRQAKADRSAQQKERKRRAAEKRRRKGRDADDDGDDEAEEQVDLSEITAPRVDPVRRPGLEALGVLALGGALAAGAISAAWRMLGPQVAEWWTVLAPYRYLIVLGGGLAWMTAAWMVAAPPAPTPEDDPEDEYDDDPEDEEDPPPAPDRGMALLLHVITDLSDAEFSKRAGVHLDVLLDSATAAGHIPEGTEQTEFRAWLEAAGLPTEDKLGMRIEGKPVTRAGVRIDAATRVLGMTPTALLNARQQTPVPAPAQAPARVPAQAAPAAPAQALLRLIPGGLHDPFQTPPPTASQDRVQETR
ncbi:hypothetical protein ACFV2Q_38355 [Streptomyces sp. NPDC059650]|uniref:hypothetical protein n=1 Tax=Streptomyces sp. NPDC059650 TaxID=3346896 RepID=UPI0036A6F677